MYWEIEPFLRVQPLPLSRMAAGRAGLRGTILRSTSARCPTGFMLSISGLPTEARILECTSFRLEEKNQMAATLLRPIMPMLSRSSSKAACRYICLALCVAFTFAAQPGVAKPMEIACPSDVPAKTIHVESSSPDWVPFVDDSALLVGANASAGPPGSFATLVGDPSTHAPANTQSVTYRFDPEHQHNGNWIECIYGGRPEISLYKRLQDDVSECTIETRRRSKTEAAQVRIVCKKG